MTDPDLVTLDEYRCLRCQEALQVPAEEVTQCVPGNITVCRNCGTLQAFGETMPLVPLSAGERAAAMCVREIRLAVRAAKSGAGT